MGTLIKLLYRAYVTASERYTTALMFSTLSRFRFLENCIIELLRMDDKVAYRLGYACVRQLASSCVRRASRSRRPRDFFGDEGQDDLVRVFPVHGLHGLVAERDPVRSRDL